VRRLNKPPVPFLFHALRGRFVTVQDREPAHVERPYELQQVHAEDERVEQDEEQEERAREQIHAPSLPAALVYQDTQRNTSSARLLHPGTRLPWPKASVRQTTGVYSKYPVRETLLMADTIPGIHSDPDILGGTPVFVGTRVPVRALLDYLEHGRPLAEFLDDFPTVDKALAVGVLEHMKQLVTHAPSAR
jgi:uncharacterized protein (DUF433 family)